MHGNKSVKPDFNAEYDMSELLKPHKLVVNFGEKNTLQYDNDQNSEMYDQIFKEAKRIIRIAILTNSRNEVKRLPVEELTRIRNTRGVSFIFNSPLEMEAVYKLMNISSEADLGIKSTDEMIVAVNLNKVYIQDTAQNMLCELSMDGIQNNMSFIISSLEKQPTVYCLFMDRFEPERYSKNAVVPTKMGEKGLPVLSGQKELAVTEGIPDKIADFFEEDISSISIIKNMDGTLIYTDREDQWVYLYTNGMLEYVNYKSQAAANSATNIRSAIDVSTEFVSRHFGFPDNSYISDVIKSMKGDKYIIKYRYSYEGLPIVLDSGPSSDTIEVEVSGNEVRRYKRLVRTIDKELESKQVINFIDVLNVLLDKKVEVLSGEKIKNINDMYLAYYERYSQNGITYIPVWVADVMVEKLDKGTVLKQRYVINAETGIILDK